MTEPQMYATIFFHLADKMADAQKEARELMRQYLERGLEPQDLLADYTLVQLGLAEEVNADDFTGNTYFEYTDVDGEI